ncbi:hypothetical protein KAR48_09390 [bacterium]|nr:hypothetical protein [bacterium]
MRFMLNVFLLAGIATASADQVKIIEIEDVHRYHFEERLLTLNKDVDIHIEAVGSADRYGDDMLAMGWILNSSTREVVWELTTANSERSGSRFLRKATEDITLDKGVYEVYYAVAPQGLLSGRIKDLGDVIVEIFGSKKRSRDYRRYASKWKMSLAVDKKAEKHVEVGNIQSSTNDKDVLAQFISLGDGEHEEQGFTLTRDMEVRIYAVGEGEDGEMFDYGWVINAKTGETVWQMNYRKTDWAGGAEKNRKIDTHITLDKGSYLVAFMTDDSHSYDEWNLMPPRDPRYWGMTITTTSSQGKYVKPFEPASEVKKLIVDMTRADDDFFDEYGFILDRKLDLRVRCVGEMGTYRRFVDYGWILDAETREVVWEMDRRNTRHAGGGSKNRIFDGIVSLDAGKYIAYYVTDGSHAYRDWNTGAPFNPRSYGLAIWGSGDDFNKNMVKPYLEEDDPLVLVSMIRAHDGDRLRGRFQIEKDTRVRIYCLGEGDDDEMFDYGWIEDDDGRTVWTMEYWDTDHAGGVNKNRVINEVIRLKAGKYRAYYRTDSSHSYEDWNDDPPRDPKYWGLTVRKEK